MHKHIFSTFINLISIFLLSACITTPPPEETRFGRLCIYLEEQAEYAKDKAIGHIEKSMRKAYIGSYEDMSKHADLNVEQSKEFSKIILELENKTNKLPRKEFLHDITKVSTECSPILQRSDNYREKESLALEEISTKIKSYYLAKERKTFLERTAGKEECLNRYGQANTLTDVLMPILQPSKECLYYNKPNQIQAYQVTSKGILGKIFAAPPGLQNTAFIYNDNDKDRALVDGDMVPDGYFVYAGTKQYNTLLGEKTVHSYSRLRGDPYEGLLFYNHP